LRGPRYVEITIDPAPKAEPRIINRRMENQPCM
jgi:hypothetical protein